MYRILHILLVLILVLTALFTVYKVWEINEERLNHYRIEQDIEVYSPASSESMKQQVLQVKPSLQTQAGEIADVAIPQLKVPVNLFLLSMKDDVNPDIAGWINIPDTNIDYPVVQSDNNEFYLSHDINKDDSSSGSIFLDYRCDSELAYYNTVIYGHNMRNRTMFYDLRLFADPGFFEDIKTGTLYTVYGTYTLNFFAYLVVASTDSIIYTNMPVSEDYFEYIEENSLNYRSPENPERIVTLSTCAYDFEGARIVLLAYVC